MMRNTKLASVQQHYVRSREIIDGTLCIFSPLSPTKRSYRAILEVAPINFLLKSEEEQEALTERYRLLLKSLPFPLEMLMRHQRLDLEPYLARVRAQSTHIPPGMPGMWRQLADNLERLLQQLGSQRTLIERRCYLIVPAPEPFAPGLRRRKCIRQNLAAQAVQELDIRVETLSQQFLSLGLRVRRLRGEEIAQLLQSCLVPERAWRHPLQREHLAVVGHMPCSKKHARVSGQHGYTGGYNDPPLLNQQSSGKTQQRQRARVRKESVLPPPDFLRLADLLAPSSIEEFPQALRLGEHDWVRGITITAFPREVTPGWLAPLLMHDDILDIVMHLHPQKQAVTVRQLKRRRAGYISMRAFRFPSAGVGYLRDARRLAPGRDLSHRRLDKERASRSVPFPSRPADLSKAETDPALPRIQGGKR